MTEALVRNIQTILVNSGDSVSGNINLVGARGQFALHVPTVASASNLFFQVGPNSGSYIGRLQDPTSQSAYLKAAGNGSLGLVVDLWPWPHARIEFAQAVAVPLTLQAFIMGQRAGVGANRE